ncbi:MAG: hypothetical protein KGM99_03535, partial [Burkholderiales bacterium]|nr:hypothetical protein [Burkholderiales bacterium]
MVGNHTYWALALTALCTACAAPGPAYHYTPSSPDDPNITFQSDYSLHTNFYVNTKAPELNHCSDLVPLGFTLREVSVFIRDKPVPKIDIQTAAGKPVTVKAVYN